MDFGVQSYNFANILQMHPSSEGNSMFPSSSDGKKIEFNIVTISLTTQNADSKLGLSTDESYTLTIAPYYEVRAFIINLNCCNLMDSKD